MSLGGGRVVGSYAGPGVDVVGAPPPGAGPVALHAGEEDVAAVVAVEPGPPVLEALHAVAVRGVDVSRSLVWDGAEHAFLGAVAVVHVKVQQRHAADPCTQVCYIDKDAQGGAQPSLHISWQYIRQEKVHNKRRKQSVSQCCGST